MSEKYTDSEAKIIKFPDRFILPRAVTDPEEGRTLDQRADELAKNIRITIDQRGGKYKLRSLWNRGGETAYARSTRNGKQPFELIIETLDGGGVLVYKPWLTHDDKAINFHVGGGNPPFVAYGRPDESGEGTDFAKSTRMDEQSFERLIDLLQTSHLVGDSRT